DSGSARPGSPSSRERHHLQPARGRPPSRGRAAPRSVASLPPPVERQTSTPLDKQTRTTRTAPVFRGGRRRRGSAEEGPGRQCEARCFSEVEAVTDASVWFDANGKATVESAEGCPHRHPRSNVIAAPKQVRKRRRGGTAQLARLAAHLDRAWPRPRRATPASCWRVSDQRHNLPVFW